MSLTFEERKKTILDWLDKDEKVQVLPLAEQLSVTTETIRRDLDRLEKEGRLKKVYGGAVRTRENVMEPPFMKRSLMQPDEKAAIGVFAASLVQEGETVMIDNGTTTLEVLKALRDRADVTVVTHSVPVLLYAMEMFKGQLIFVGGQMDVQAQAATGAMTENSLQQFKVHKAFISVGGVSLKDGISDYNVNEASISRCMMARAEESIVVADHTKLGQSAFAKIADIKQVSMLITDRGCSADWAKQWRETGNDIFITE